MVFECTSAPESAFTEAEAVAALFYTHTTTANGAKSTQSTELLLPLNSEDRIFGGQNNAGAAAAGSSVVVLARTLL